MDSRKLADTFSYAKKILKFVTTCGGIKAISKSAWQRTNGKVWAQFQSDLFTWILMMVVCTSITQILNVQCFLIIGIYFFSFISKKMKENLGH